jgi:hypothetical protein
MGAGMPAKQALDKLTPLRSKLPKTAPDSVQRDYAAFTSLADAFLADVKKALSWDQSKKDVADYQKKKKELDDKNKELAGLADKINKAADIQLKQRSDYMGDGNALKKSADKLVAALKDSKDKAAQDLSNAVSALGEAAYLLPMAIEVPAQHIYDYDK